MLRWLWSRFVPINPFRSRRYLDAVTWANGYWPLDATPGGLVLETAKEVHAATQGRLDDLQKRAGDLLVTCFALAGLVGTGMTVFGVRLSGGITAAVVAFLIAAALLIVARTPAVRAGASDVPAVIDGLEAIVKERAEQLQSPGQLEAYQRSWLALHLHKVIAANRAHLDWLATQLIVASWVIILGLVLLLAGALS
jgi:hypothetical protein